MGKVLVIDIDKCNGCYNCQISCKDEHVGNDWSPIAKPQPDTGQFWNKVTDYVRGSVPKVKMSYLHSICQHCDAAPCIESCSVKAIYKRDDGIVIIDPEKCRGQRSCVEACPYGAIRLQRRPQHRTEVHVLRPPAGRRLEGAQGALTRAPPEPSPSARRRI